MPQTVQNGQMMCGKPLRKDLDLLQETEAMGNYRRQRIKRNTTIKVRLQPTIEQAELFEKTFQCCRYIWNHILADAEEFYAATDKHFLPTPAAYKKQAAFLKEADSQALCSVHQNLRRAFQNFFQHPERCGYPAYKNKDSPSDSYMTFCQHTKRGPTIYLTEDGVRLPKAGLVRAKIYRKPLHWWVLRSAVVSRKADGRYYCSLHYEYTVEQPKQAVPKAETTVGLNYSVPHFYVDSNGHRAAPPKWIRQSEGKLGRMRQRLSRMQHGSQNYQEQLRKIQRLSEHIANQRKDFLHKESSRIAEKWDTVCVKDTDLREMSKKIKLGNVMDSGFGRFRLYLQYKLARQGKNYVMVDSKYPSAKTCHICGHVNEALEMKERAWVCPVCGNTLQRSENGAVNIRDQGLRQLQAGGGSAAGL